MRAISGTMISGTQLSRPVRHRTRRLALAAIAAVLVNAGLIALLATVSQAMLRSVDQPLPVLALHQVEVAPIASPESVSEAEGDAESAPALPPLPALELAPSAPSGEALRLPVPDFAPPLAEIPMTIPAFRVASAEGAGVGVGVALPVAAVFAPLDEPPVLLTPIDLDRFYPRPARLHRQEGSTVLTLAISELGVVEQCSVDASTPPGVFDAAALELGRALRFRAARHQQREVATSYRLKVVWTLEGR